MFEKILYRSETETLLSQSFPTS